jgi:hypothetical protein
VVRFGGLPPGNFRLLSTFDFDDPDEETMQAARPKELLVKEGGSEPQDLDLYIK